MQSTHVGRFRRPRFYFSCFSAAFPFPSNDLSSLCFSRSVRSPRSTSSGVSSCAYKTGEDGESNLAKVASSIYRQRRVVQFRISNWYLPARRKVRRYGATKVRLVVENVTYVSRVPSSLQHSINNATSDSSH